MLGSNPLKTLTAPSCFALATIASRLVSKMKPLASASFFAFNKAALDSAAEPFVVATTFCYRLNSLVLLRQFPPSPQFLVGLCDQVLGAHVRDSGNFVLQPTNQLFLAQHVLESRR